MSKEKKKVSFVVYEDWARIAVESGDAELAMAIIAHGIGVDVEISNPVSRAYFASQIAPIMDANAVSYEKTCESRRAAANARWGQRDANALQKDANAYQVDSTSNAKADMIYEKMIDEKMIDDRCLDSSLQSIPTVSPSENREKRTPNGVPKEKPKQETTLRLYERISPSYDLSGVMDGKLREWIAYKTERRQPYKETGLKNLLGRIVRSVNEYGEEAVMDLIDNSISSGYTGIIFDSLARRSPHRKNNDTLKGVMDWAKENAV